MQESIERIATGSGHIIEIGHTRDRRYIFADGCDGTKPKPPAGKAWKIAYYGHEKYTTWQRLLCPVEGK
ncbi:hypothetical protein CN071_18990 [Sinorhizobium meliloti]|uniref:hypothetical protein n=1 Tax=Rhizobium meliloti TaxID=382 RepID=UPI000FDA84A1|nr:hypothetical protein [Sinorhizobium meliloti]RVP64647.1 hypothetical protein CN071_18990 [Sinorhizobium meliloti]